ncbi:hypothetical protein M9458_057228, partial [Cirrhinus mrigala]
LTKPTLTVTPDSPVFTGETVNLKCEIKSDHSDWSYVWYKDSTNKPMLQTSDHYTVNGDTLTIRAADKADADQYWCKGKRDGQPDSEFSDFIKLYVKDLPTSTLTVTPDSPVFTGETVNLKCVIESDHSDWRYEWYKGSNKVSDHHTVNRDTHTIRVKKSDEGQYTCKGQRDGRPNSSQSSSAVSLSVT